MTIRGRVYAIDDEPAVRDSLRVMLQTYDFEVLTFASAEEFLGNVDPSATGCVVVDVRMPGMSGLDLQRAIAKRAWRLPVIVITGHADVPMAVAALKAGAIDFIEKPIDDEQLVSALEDALARWQSDRDEEVELAELAARRRRLTPREAEIMDLVVAGLSSPEIAVRLQISTRTVEHHRAQVMDKMEASNVSRLVRMAIVLGDKEPPGGVNESGTR